VTHRTFLQWTAIWALLLWISGCETADRAKTAASPAATESVERVSQNGPVELLVRFTPREPRLSDVAEMDIEVTAKPGVEIKPPTFGQAVGDFVVRDFTERTDKAVPKGTASTVRRFRYKLEPMSAGRHLIRSLSIDFVDNRPESEQKGVASTIESEPFEVNVTSELGDQVPNLANLDPMLPPRPISGTTHWAWWAAGTAIVLGSIAALLMRRRRKATLFVPPKKTPEQIAHEAFAALLAENLPAQGLFKQFYLRLTGIVRTYIEGTTGLHAPEQTTEEFLREMRSRNVFSVDRSIRLKEFLEAADMVKFAGQQPDNDQIETATARAREFVDLHSNRDVPTPVVAEVN
jgi:hypothetical protein